MRPAGQGLHAAKTCRSRGVLTVAYGLQKALIRQPSCFIRKITRHGDEHGAGTAEGGVGHHRSQGRALRGAAARSPVASDRIARCMVGGRMGAARHHGGDEFQRAGGAQRCACIDRSSSPVPRRGRIAEDFLMAAVSTGSLPACRCRALMRSISRLAAASSSARRMARAWPSTEAGDVSRRSRARAASRRDGRATRQRPRSSSTSIAAFAQHQPAAILRERLARGRRIHRVFRRQRLQRFPRFHRAERERRLGAAGNHHVRLSACDAPRRRCRRRRRRRARRRIGEVRPLQPVVQPDPGGGGVAHRHQHAEGLHAIGDLGVKGAIAVVGGLRAAHAGADEHARAAQVEPVLPECATPGPRRRARTGSRGRACAPWTRGMGRRIEVHCGAMRTAGARGSCPCGTPDLPATGSRRTPASFPSGDDAQSVTATRLKAVGVRATASR